MKQKLVLVLSVLVGLLAFWLTQQYFHRRLAAIEEMRLQILASGKQVDVVVAGRDLPAGTVLTIKDLKAKSLPERGVSKNTILDARDVVDQIVGKKLIQSLDRGETIMWSYVDVPYRPGSGLAPMINLRMRAVSISVGGAAAVSGLVQPNDHVDVIGTFSFPSKDNVGEMEAVTLTVLQDITILATGQTLAKAGFDTAGRARTSGGYSMVTVEVTPREVELLVFAETMKGRLTLSLRNPGDISYETNLPSVNFQQIEKVLPELNAFRQESIRHKASP